MAVTKPNVTFQNGVGTIVFGWTATAGRLIVIAAQKRDLTVSATDFGSAGYTKLEEITAGSFQDGVSLFAKVAVGTETQVTFPGGSSPNTSTVWEVAGSNLSLANIAHAQIDSGTSSTTHTAGTVTPPSGRGAIILGGIAGSDDTWNAAYTAGAGYTLDGSSGGSHPQSAGLSRIVASTSGSYTPSATASASHPWRGVVAAVYEGVGSAVGVRMDWDEDGFGTGTYDDVTTDVMGWTITRGASAEITGGANPGSATITLRRTNRDGRYNPRFTGGPLYGKLRDGVRVHIAINQDGTISGAGTIRGLFAGRITDITPLASEGTDPVPITEVVCEDPLSWYSRTPVHIADSRTRSHGALRLAVLGAIGETRFDLDNEIETMPLSSAEGDAFAVLGQINSANGTRHFAKPSAAYDDWYRYTTRNRQYKLAGVSDASLNASSNHVTDTAGWRMSADTVTNQQRAAVEEIAFLDAARVVWEHDDLPLIVAGTVVVWADLPDYVDTPTVEYTNTGTAPTVTLTPFGRTAKLTLVSAGTTTFTMLRIRGNEVVRGDAQAYISDDLTSQAVPRGVRAGSDISGEYVGVLAMARGIAQHVTWRYGNPQMRPTLTVHNWFPYQFQLDLSDLIAFTASQFSASALLFEIVGLTHTSDVASTTVQHHTTTYVLQECRVQTDPGWFIVGTSTLNSSAILGY